MKLICYIIFSLCVVSIVTGQSLTPIHKPDKKHPSISEAFQGETLVQRTVDASGLAHYLIRFHHKDVVEKPGPYLSEVVLSVSNDQGKILSQSVLDVSGVSTNPPDELKFRIIRFSVHESLESECVLSIGLHKGFRVIFSPYLLANQKKKMQNKSQ
jgi:hypothetical protein